MNAKLRQAITTPMRTILAVRAAFGYCATVEDIKEVIKKIPPKFGEFEILVISEEEGYFMIQNFFEKNGETHSQTVSYDFYNVKEDYYYDYGRKA
jgi:hypothetical protein